jgi:hypothetical protein
LVGKSKEKKLYEELQIDVYCIITTTIIILTIQPVPSPGLRLALPLFL